MSSEASSTGKSKNCTIPATGVRLKAVIHQPQGQNTGYSLVICHGFRGSKEGGGRAVQMAEKAALLGFGVVRFDFTPQSSLSRQVSELRAVVDYTRLILGTKIILVGRSMGGSAALAFAAKEGGIAGLCLWATPWNLEETFRLALGWGYQKLVNGENLYCEDEYGKLRLMPEFIRDFADYDLLACIEALTGTPLLLVHGSDDDVVPLRQAETLYEKAGQPKDMVVIPGGDHQFVKTHQVATGAVLDWLARMFPAI